MADETSICNMALARLGQSQILSLDDQSPAARYCRQFYAQTRDEVLRSHPWNFAGKRLVLSQLSTGPIFGWAYAYALPTDFLRALQLNGYSPNESARYYEIEGRNLLTNEGTAQVRYVSRVTDPNTFDPLFIEALTVKIGSKLARPLTGSQQSGDGFLTEYERITAPLARQIDAREGRVPKRSRVVDSSWIRARFGSWSG